MPDKPLYKKTVLFIGFTWPEPTTTAAGTRMLQLLHFFLEQAYRTVFASTASKTPFSLDLNTIGVEKADIKLNDPSFDQFIKELDPQIVLFDRFLTEEQFGWRIAEFAPQALRILDTQDLHSLRTTRQALFNEEAFSTDAWLQGDTAKREIASIYRCDLSLIISSYEMNLLTETLKIDKNLLLHLPFMLDTLEIDSIEKWPSFEARRDFICIGNGKHAPNINAILWLKKEIWPLIRKQLNDVHLYIYGAYLPQPIQEMNNAKEGFRVMGWTENAEAVLQKARVGLAPLRFGAGIKGKLVDAMQAGTPTITTYIGAEGMHADYPWNGSIEATAEDFAQAAVRLYQNPQEWKRAQQNGVAIINGLYNKVAMGKKWADRIATIENNLAGHRRQNFIGAMLLHHTLASTKYMARWIAAKNKLR